MNRRLASRRPILKHHQSAVFQDLRRSARILSRD
jgi:hypothetical protein